MSWGERWEVGAQEGYPGAAAAEVDREGGHGGLWGLWTQARLRESQEMEGAHGAGRARRM